MPRRKSHGRGRGRRHQDSGAPVALSQIVRNFATEQEIARRNEERQARKERKFHEHLERRERMKGRWEKEKLDVMERAGVPVALLDKFRPHLVGATFLERLEDERRQFFAWLEKTKNSVSDTDIGGLGSGPRYSIGEDDA